MRNALDPAVGERLLATLRAALPTLDLVIVNQQLVRGIHTEAFRAGLARLIREAAGRRGAAAAVPFLADSRVFSDSYDGAMRKINDREEQYVTNQ